MRTFPLIPATPAAPGFDLTLTVPDQGSTATPCACAGLAIAWFNGSDLAVVLDSDEAFPAFAISGSICPDTSYTISSSWAPDGAGDEPPITQFGASAWAVEPTDPGILTVNVSASCAGQTFALGPIILTIILGDYAPTPCVAPTDYTNILDLAAASCVAIIYDGAGVAGITASATDWFYFPVPWYQNFAGGVSEAVGTTITFEGLRSLFGSSDMMVKVTITDGSLTPGAYPFYCDNKNDADDFPLTPGTSWEYTIANADIDTWITGFGTGDGAGDLSGGDYFQFHIEVKKA